MKHHLLLGIYYVLLAALFASCASSAPSRSSQNPLGTTSLNIPKTSSGQVDMSKIKSEIVDLLKTAEIQDLKKSNLNISTSDITVSDDKIEIKSKNQTNVINFADLVNSPITFNRQYYRYAKVKPSSNGTCVVWARVNGKLTQIIYKPYLVQIGDLISCNYIDKKVDDAEKLAADLLIMQNIAIKKQADGQLKQFDAAAAQYRALKVKPPISEEQRKFIVQGNAFNQEKNYNKAIEFYQKAIEIDQTAYPSAYMNLALLSAQVNKFDVAIFNMKKYLLLEPDSKDARSAQDKIYEWEIKIENK